MTVVTVNCVVCGVVRLDPHQLVLVPMGGSVTGLGYRFDHCGTVTLRPANRKVVEVLQVVGVRLVDSSLPDPDLFAAMLEKVGNPLEVW